MNNDNSKSTVDCMFAVPVTCKEELFDLGKKIMT